MSSKVSYEAVGTAEPVVEGNILVQVESPADLPEGYTFEASYEGQVFPVQVPPGGLKKGEKYNVPFDPTTASTSVTATVSTRKWKDDLFDCFNFGICHPSFLNAIFCPLVLLGQIMTRLRLDWAGDPAPADSWSKTFRIMLYVTVGYMVVGTILAPADLDEVEDGAAADHPTYDLVTSLYGAFILFVTFKVRKYVRERDQIPEERCGGCEDFCCSFWCGCCVVSQMARHTADYDREPAQFCSKTGVPTEVPVMVV